jgi:hypothetical protein
MYAILSCTNLHSQACSYRITSNTVDIEKERMMKVLDVNDSVTGIYTSTTNLKQILCENGWDMKAILVSPLNLSNVSEAETLKLIFEEQKCQGVVLCAIPNNDKGIRYQNAFRETPSCVIL